jgi:hypothetical protein
MSRCSKVWLVAGVLFSLANFAAGVFAAAQGELLHAGYHAGLMVLGASFVWWLASRRSARRIWRQRKSVSSGAHHELTDRLTHLEQSIDAVAIEVERIGEGQRFMTRLFTENGIPRAPGEGAVKPSEINAPEAAPHVRRY